MVKGQATSGNGEGSWQRFMRRRDDKVWTVAAGVLVALVLAVLFKILEVNEAVIRLQEAVEAKQAADAEQTRRIIILEERAFKDGFNAQQGRDITDRVAGLEHRTFEAIRDVRGEFAELAKRPWLPGADKRLSVLEDRIEILSAEWNRYRGERGGVGFQRE